MSPRPSFRSRSHSALRLIGITAGIYAVIAAGTLTTSIIDTHTSSHTASGTSAESAPLAGHGTGRGTLTKPNVSIRTFTPPADITITSNVEYGRAPDGTALLLDVCQPATKHTQLYPAILSIHGGSWARGDKGNHDWHAVCTWLASAGFVAYSLNYRLVPAARFPAAIDDVTQALRWVRESDNARRFSIDPERIGVFGGSAGGNLAALLGMRGTGDIHSGTRVAAVAELSGPVDLTESGHILGDPSERLSTIELKYLGCRSFRTCPAVTAASPIFHVDASDPPVFIGASRDDFVPAQQGEAFAAALARAGVPHTLVIDRGRLHSIGILDAKMRTDVAAFLHRYLG